MVGLAGWLRFALAGGRLGCAGHKLVGRCRSAWVWLALGRRVPDGPGRQFASSWTGRCRCTLGEYPLLSLVTWHGFTRLTCPHVAASKASSMLLDGNQAASVAGCTARAEHASACRGAQARHVLVGLYIDWRFGGKGGALEHIGGGCTASSLVQWGGSLAAHGTVTCSAGPLHTFCGCLPAAPAAENLCQHHPRGWLYPLHCLRRSFLHARCARGFQGWGRQLAAHSHVVVRVVVCCGGCWLRGVLARHRPCRKAGCCPGSGVPARNQCRACSMPTS